MKTWAIIYSMLKADFLERTRRSSFLATVCLVIYIGYAVNTGQILIKLDTYRGVYNSAWVGSLMAVVITFFLGMIGFFLVKNTIERDEHTGVGQIIATTSLTRSQYLLGKWLSNVAVLTSLIVILMIAAFLMQLIHREVAQIQLWPLFAPFLFIAFPMMALVAAFAVLFEAISWLKGGFGNIVYFLLFTFLLIAGIQLPQFPWLDVIGLNLVGSSMKAAAKAAFPAYSGSFVLAMISGKPLETFIWPGLNWTPGLILQRLSWLAISVGAALAGSLFFNRFDPSRRSDRQLKQRALSVDGALARQDTGMNEKQVLHLTPLANSRFHSNFARLAWLEFLLLIKGLKWYWLAGMTALWISCIVSPSETMRKFSFMFATIWPVLIWAKLGEREARYQTEHLIYHAARPLARLLGSSWLAGVMLTAIAASGTLLGRLLHAEPLALFPWALSVLFIPTLALSLGVWSRNSKTFEVVYPILWYLGPFNPGSGLVVLDYLGIHSEAIVRTSPLWVAGIIALLLLSAIIGRRQRVLG